MTNEDRGGILSLVLFGVGILVGGFFVYMITRERAERVAYPVSYKPLRYGEPLREYSDNYGSNYRLYPEPEIEPKISMKNKEEWTVKRNKDGKIEGIVVHRDVSKGKKLSDSE